MWSWYLADRRGPRMLGREILLDLDKAAELLPSGVPRIEGLFRRGLRRAIASGKLDVEGVWLFRSTTPHHFSAVVRLKKPRPMVERIVWGLHFGSHLPRAKADALRFYRGAKAPSLLILPNRIPGFYRKPDAECACVRKHDTREQFDLGKKACPVWVKYRGLSLWELWGEPGEGAERFVSLPVGGRVPLEWILKRERV